MFVRLQPTKFRSDGVSEKLLLASGSLFSVSNGDVIDQKEMVLVRIGFSFSFLSLILLKMEFSFDSQQSIHTISQK